MTMNGHVHVYVYSGKSILPHFTIVLLEFEIVPTVSYVLFFILFHGRHIDVYKRGHISIDLSMIHKMTIFVCLLHKINHTFYFDILCNK